MRILWHGAHPDLPTGYANQARVWIPRLHKAGHQVAISVLGGVTSHMTRWRIPGTDDAIPVFPMTPYENFGQDVLAGHYRAWEADLIISLTCTWVYNPEPWRGLRTVFITPVDVEGMSRRDVAMITDSGGTPAAVCRWGEAQMKSRELDPLYLPHGIETRTWRPPRNRKRLRVERGLDHLYLVGINAANHERARKCFPEMLLAFAEFHAKHPDSKLLLHTLALLPEGINLPLCAAEAGIPPGAVIWSDQYSMAIGETTWEDLARYCGCLDVLLMCGNEGFGLPTIEGQACGTPVIAGNWGPGPELAGSTGWLVEGQKDWNNWHGKWWRTPLVGSIADALEAAYAETAAERAERRKACRANALNWDADRLWADHWESVIKELEGQDGDLPCAVGR